MAGSESFDLDSVLKFSCDYAQLKRVLEYLLSQGKETAELVAKLKVDLQAAQTIIQQYVHNLWLDSKREARRQQECRQT